MTSDFCPLPLPPKQHQVGRMVDNFQFDAAKFMREMKKTRRALKRWRKELDGTKETGDGLASLRFTFLPEGTK